MRAGDTRTRVRAGRTTTSKRTAGEARYGEGSNEFVNVLGRHCRSHVSRALNSSVITREIRHNACPLPLPAARRSGLHPPRQRRLSVARRFRLC